MGPKSDIITVFQGSNADYGLALDVAEQMRAEDYKIHMLSVVYGLKPRSHFVVIGDERKALEATIEARSQDAIIHHLYAGDRSGCHDDYYRNAISSLADYLYPVSIDALDRLLDARAFLNRQEGITLCLHPLPEPDDAKWINHPPYAYARLHPNTLDPLEPYKLRIEKIMCRAEAEDLILYVGSPNQDKGSEEIKWNFRHVQYATCVRCRAAFLPPLPRAEYLGMLKHAKWIAGNSSSFVLDVPEEDQHKVTLYGSRQKNRSAPTTHRDARSFGATILQNVEFERRNA